MASRKCSVCGEPRLPGGKFCSRCGGDSFASPRRGLNRADAGARGNYSDLLYVAVAAMLAVLVSHVPVVDMLIYPFKLFATFVHEWGHALIAIATGGQVRDLQINGDLSGETYTAGGWQPLILSAGYLGAAIAGALLLLTRARYANRVLVLVGGLSLLMPLAGALFFGTSFTSLTWLWAAIFGGVALFVGLRAPVRIAALFQQFLAVELCFTALDSLRFLDWLSANTPSMPSSAPCGQYCSDALFAQQRVGLPAEFWAILWTVIAVAAIALACFRVVRRSIA